MNQASSRSSVRRWALPLVAIVLIVGAVMVGRALLAPRAAKLPIPFETVERRDIVMSVESNGSVEPIDLVEVKSKASGQILRMPVQVGSVVKRGDLLAQIDPVDVKNQYDQAAAALQAAQTKVTISTAQNKRSESLYADRVITAEEHESATLDLANAQSQLVKARTDLDIARQRRDDATVRAPIAGTVLAQPVSVGQVISSATSSVSGGTTLLQMADLGRVRIRALVSETDIGSLHPGQAATVQVDAYPQRSFRGVVEKIEPQAVVQQSVTMFPVLVSISNEDGVLLPGMNGEVTVVVDQRRDVLAVPLDAVRTMRELSAVAKAMGLDADSLQAVVRAARAARTGGRDSTRAGGRGNAGGRGRAQAMIAMARTEKGVELRIVRVGLSDFDYGEVLGGLKEGDQVAMLSVAQIQAQRAESINQIRERVSGGVGGVGGGSGTGASRRSGGGSGGPPGGP